jgi:glycosyl transferase family 25
MTGGSGVTPTNVFVINLAEQTNRRALMLAQLKAAGIDGEIVEAISGTVLSPEQIASVYDAAAAKATCGRELARGEIGCALSHQSIYRRVLAQDLPWAVIIEDDTLLGRDFPPVLSAVVGSLDAHVPTVYLFSHVERYTNWGRQRLTPGRRWLVTPVRAYGGHCYLVTTAAARALLESNQPIHFPVDYWMTYRKLGAVKLRAVVPYCAGYAPPEQDSVIRAERALKESQGRKGEAQSAWRRFGKYLYWKVLYQLGVKQCLRVKKQRVLW